MIHSNLIGKENRLIYRMASDFEDQTRYTGRVAQANAAAQATTHQAALSKNQQSAATEQAAAGNTKGAAYYSNAAQSLVPATQPLVTGSGMDARATDAGILNQARATAGSGVDSYNTQTGETSKVNTVTNPNTGQVYTGAAADRLSERLGLIDTSTLQLDRYSDGSVIPGQDLEKKKAEIEKQNTEKLKQNDIISEREKKRTDNAAANTAAGSTKGKAKPAAKPVASSNLDRISTILDGIIGASGDPMGPVYKEMMMQDFQDMEDTKMSAAASYGDSINRAEDQNNDVQSLIDKYTAIHRENNDKFTALLDETRDSQQKYLAEQQQRDEEKLAWDSNREQQKLTKQKTDQLLKQSIQNALGGGAFSGAASEQLASTEREWDSAISDLAKEYSFKRADVSAMYTQKYIDTNNQFNLEVFNAAKDLDSKIEGYAIQGFNSLQAMENAKTDAADNYRSTVDAAKKTYSSSLKSHIADIQKGIVDLRTEKSKTQGELWDRLFRQRAQDGNLNPGLTNQILGEMKAAGIDTTGLDSSAMTLEQQNEMYRRAKDAEAAASAGKVPLATQVQQLTDADKAFSLLDKAERAIKDYAGVGGNIGGMTGLGDTDPSWGARIGKFGADVATGFGIPGVSGAMEKQREAVVTFGIVQQVIGKALEGGVLRKEDEVKYSKLLPNLRDSDGIRAKKLTELRSMLEDGKRSLLDNMQRSGYNTSGYNVDSTGKPYDPIGNSSSGTLTNDEADEILNSLETGQPLSQSTPTGFLNTLAMAHAKHEGYGTAGAPSITKNNNPGALRWAGGQSQFGGVKPGAKKPDGTINTTGFTWFPDVGSGYKALTADLRAKLTGGSSHIDYSKNPTMLDYISVYAPSGDGNNPSSYTKALVSQLKKAGYDVSPTTPLSELSRFLS